MLNHIEALIFTAEAGITEKEIAESLSISLGKEISPTQVAESIEFLKQKYKGDDSFMELHEINNAWVFLTKKEFNETIKTRIKETSTRKLSSAALETLAIVAYNQPVTKLDIEQIRGVNSDYTVQKLLEKDLIKFSGKKDAPGKPILYATSDAFMDHFGLKNIDELPKMKEVVAEANEIGN